MEKLSRDTNHWEPVEKTATLGMGGEVLERPQEWTRKKIHSALKEGRGGMQSTSIRVNSPRVIAWIALWCFRFHMNQTVWVYFALMYSAT